MENPGAIGPPIQARRGGGLVAKGSWTPRALLPVHSPCCLQIMLLETARRYNHETECITFLKDFTYSKDDFHRAGMATQAAGGGGPASWETPATSATAAALSLPGPPFFHFQRRARVKSASQRLRSALLSAVGRSAGWDGVASLLVRWASWWELRHSLLPHPECTQGMLGLVSLL